MDYKEGDLHALLGLDIGYVNTRASYFEIIKEKFSLQARGSASSSLGYGLQPASGAGSAMKYLQSRSDVHILQPNGTLIWPFYETGLGVDRIAVTISAGPKLRTVLLGLSEEGSLRAGRALIQSQPLQLVGTFGLSALTDQSNLVDDLVALHPDIVILTGGENGGAEREMQQWIDVVRLVCNLLPGPSKPHVMYAGNVLLEEMVKRNLEAVSALTVLPNIRPYQGDRDLLPAMSALNRIIVNLWQEKLPGFKSLTARTKATVGTKSFSLERMVRFLSQTNKKNQKGVLALDLGGGSTVLAAGSNGRTGALSQPAWRDVENLINSDLVDDVYRWTAESVSREEVRQFLCNHALTPSFVPEDPLGSAMSQAYTRCRIRCANRQFAQNHPWYPYEPGKGLVGQFEPIIASGAVITTAVSPGQRLMTLVDGLQPWGVTTFVLDRYHIFPLLGVAGAFSPVLPVHILSSDIFENLGTVITAVSDQPEDTPILIIRVAMDNGKDYDVEINQGSLKRLVIPPEVHAELTLKPYNGTDIGFGGCGAGGRLKVPGGRMGVIVDARGRPLSLPADDEQRMAMLKRWSVILGS